ncbi:MAG: hypothetical protein [Microviridae sp.]|nr:MAG: hypothetical protein [Microviridae sp.]
MSTFLILLILLAKENPNETPQNVIQIQQKTVLQDCRNDPSEERGRSEYSHARRYPSVTHALLLPEGGLPISEPDREWQAKNRLQCQ